MARKQAREPQMPLGNPPLPPDQIDLVRNWVADGAKDDTPEEARETVAIGAPAVFISTGPRREETIWREDLKFLAALPAPRGR